MFAGLLLTAGSLGDRFGRYRCLAIGLVDLRHRLGAVGVRRRRPTMLIVTRALMGIGGAFIMPATLSIITNVFTDPAERGKAIGIWAGVSALGIGLGPITGGFLLEHFWWGSIFLVNVPIVIAGLVLGYFLVPESKRPVARRARPGRRGAVDRRARHAPVGDHRGARARAGRSTADPRRLRHRRRAARRVLRRGSCTRTHPMLDMRFFENPRFSAASGAITLVFLALFGTLFLLTQYLQSVLGYSTVKAGAVLLPQAVDDDDLRSAVERVGADASATRSSSPPACCS